MIIILFRKVRTMSENYTIEEVDQAIIELSNMIEVDKNELVYLIDDYEPEELEIPEELYYLVKERLEDNLEQRYKGY